MKATVTTFEVNQHRTDLQVVAGDSSVRLHPVDDLARQTIRDMADHFGWELDDPDGLLAQEATA